MPHVDTLIVGQGIAGSVLAHLLYRQQQSFRVIDAGHPNSASRVAAGMFTPVSGKRKTIQPEVLQQIEFAIPVYQDIATLLNAPILHLSDVWEWPVNEAERAILVKRATSGEHEELFDCSPIPLPMIPQQCDPVVIKRSGWVDCAMFTSDYRQWLHEQEYLWDASFDYSLLRQTNGQFWYHDWSFNHLVFCEGYRAAGNPFFSEQNIIPCKGDIIDIACDGLDESHIHKKNGYYLLPCGKQLARVGATHQWHNADVTLQEKDRHELEMAAAAILPVNSFVITRHQSGIRATTPNREVIALAHPHIPGMYMLNGLGGKGILQAPWYAHKINQLLVAAK